MNRPKALAAALTGMLLVASLASTASPAGAAGPDGVTVEGRDGVRYEGCRNYKYDYSIDTSGYDTWDAEVTFTDPRGNEAGSDYLSDGRDKATGTSSELICDDEPAGRYTIDIDVTFYDENGTWSGDAWSADTWRLRKPRTRTSFTVDDSTPRFGQILTFRIVIKLERPRGYGPNDYAAVVLEARRAGSWKRLRGSKASTDDRGVVRLSGRWERRRPLALRAATIGTKVFVRSVSRARTLG